MWYNRSGCLTQAGSLMDLFNNPRVQSGLRTLVILGSIWAAVPAPKHHENKPASVEEETAIIPVAYHPEGETVHKTQHPISKKIQQVLHEAGVPNNPELEQKVLNAFHAAGIPTDAEYLKTMLELSHDEKGCGELPALEKDACMKVHEIILHPEHVHH